MTDEGERKWIPPVTDPGKGGPGAVGGAWPTGKRGGAEYGEETDGLADNLKGKAVDMDPGKLKEKGLGAGGAVEGELGGKGKDGIRSIGGDAGDLAAKALAGAGMDEGAAPERMQPLPAPSDSKWSGGGGGVSSGGSGAGGKGADNRLASAGMTDMKSNTPGAKNAAEKTPKTRFGTGGAQGNQDPQTLLGYKSQGTTFGGGGGQTTTDGPGNRGAGVGGGGMGEGGGGAGGTGNNNNNTGGIGGKVGEIPDTGTGRPADPDEKEVGGTDACPQVNENCLTTYANYDQQIQNYEGQLQTCYTWVNMGKGGMVQVVDQACFNRVNGELQRVRGERNDATQECQARQQAACNK